VWPAGVLVPLRFRWSAACGSGRLRAADLGEQPGGFLPAFLGGMVAVAVGEDGAQHLQGAGLAEAVAKTSVLSNTAGGRRAWHADPQVLTIPRAAWNRTDRDERCPTVLGSLGEAGR